jgi:2-succinyl-5-enolpyruvyl-6-hydroxy-3-cyclohexene-1-carboxylate synthase
MPHPKQHISDLAEICRLKGIRQVVISPGSRSAPLIQSFYRVFGDDCISIVDERSAAYFALGIAEYTRNPVVLICTSGTAVLNYGPALAEAFYQHVPLLAVTADRPREIIDQQDNQTLNQRGIYRNFIKGGFDLPQVIISADDLWYSHRLINEALDLTRTPNAGPVQINVPLTEPLYDELPPPSSPIRIISQATPEIELRLSGEILQEWKQAKKIMIIHGQDHPGSLVMPHLQSLSEDNRVIVIAENIANIPGEKIIRNSNLVLSRNRKTSPEYPDLILHSGGQVVSKALTGYLRKAVNIKCWRLGNDPTIIDTFKLATRRIPLPAHAIYKALSVENVPPAEPSYRDSWLKMGQATSNQALKVIQDLPFSDLKVFSHVCMSLRPEMIIVAGNSSVIRYVQLFDDGFQRDCFGNRGVSGIDGSLSSAAGIAFVSGKLTLVMLGDLGFLYDSNGLWNRELPPNLRILVINNGGGGIFHILKGPSEQPAFKKFIEAKHTVDLQKLSAAYGLGYFYADDENSLGAQWDTFLTDSGRAAVFEVKTDPVLSASLFRELMQTT